jgi:hypothetical protein
VTTKIDALGRIEFLNLPARLLNGEAMCPQLPVRIRLAGEDFENSGSASRPTCKMNMLCYKAEALIDVLEVHIVARIKHAEEV